MRKKISDGLLDEASKWKLQRDFALLEQAVTRQDIKDGNQRYPAISFEDERGILLKKNLNGGPNLEEDELLATIKNKGITINLVSANPCLMVEFVHEPVSINSYISSWDQFSMKINTIIFLRDRFLSDPRFNEYNAGSQFSLRDGSVVTIKRDFGVSRVSDLCLSRSAVQKNLSLPLMDRFFKYFLKIASRNSDYFSSSPLYSSVPFFLHVFAYLDNVFERHFKNDKLLDKKEKQRMKGVFTQMAWYSIIQKVTKYASEHCMGEIRRTIRYLKNLQPVLIRLDRESIGKLVDKFEFFAKSHGSKIMDYKIVDGMGTIFREDLAFLIGEGESAEKAWGDIMKDFVRVKDLFAFAKEFDATYLDSVQYPLTKVCGEDAAVYEDRLLNKLYSGNRNRELENIAKEECEANYSPPAYVQDDMINRFSNREKLQESRLGVGGKMRL